MCICINCEFYQKCWIKGGISKIPKVHNKANFKLNLSSITQFTPELIRNTLVVKIFLNIFTKKQEYEFDVIECEGFCEHPGAWLQ